MPLYKLHCIAAHYPEYKHIKDLVSSSAKFLLDNGSAVRDIRYVGARTLPQRMRRHKNYHYVGDYWSMHFDAPPRLLAQLNKRMEKDNRVIRWTMLKLGERLTDIVPPNPSFPSSPSSGTLEQKTVYYHQVPTDLARSEWLAHKLSSSGDRIQAMAAWKEEQHEGNKEKSSEIVASLGDESVASLDG